VSIKDEYFAMMTSRFRQWDARFGVLTERADPAISSIDARYDERMKVIRANRDIAHRKLQEIRTANESGWRRMQAEVDDAWISVKNALDTAVAESEKRR
jgi:hypothetical protein